MLDDLLGSPFLKVKFLFLLQFPRPFSSLNKEDSTPPYVRECFSSRAYARGRSSRVVVVLLLLPSSSSSWSVYRSIFPPYTLPFPLSSVCIIAASCRHELAAGRAVVRRVLCSSRSRAPGSLSIWNVKRFITRSWRSLRDIITCMRLSFENNSHSWWWDGRDERIRPWTSNGSLALCLMWSLSLMRE